MTNWIRLTVAGGMSIVAAIAATVTASLYLSSRDPALAAQLWPGNSLARGLLSAQVIAVDMGPPTMSKAVDEAWATLVSQPGNTAAIRVMAVAAAPDRAAVSRWLLYGERQSRRDLLTQLALIEDNVGRGDIAGALRHYNRALRTSTESSTQLFPILSAAAGDPKVMVSLTQLLRQRPSWRLQFLSYFTTGPAPFAVVAPVITRLNLNPAVREDREILGHVIQKGVAESQFANALRFVPGGHSQTLRNGSFESANDWPPFDWQLADSAELSAIIERGVRPNRGNALFLIASNGRAGEVARQALSLPSGQYRLTVTAGNIAQNESERPAITLSCVGTERRIATFRLSETTPAVRPVAYDFTVPSGCVGPILMVSANTTDSGSDANEVNHPWIDDVAIEPIRGLS